MDQLLVRNQKPVPVILGVGLFNINPRLTSQPGGDLITLK